VARVWLIAVRDLQFRRRRFVIAAMVTALVFGIALAFDGVKRALDHEVPTVVGLFEADRWIVAKGTTGPFTTSQVLPASAAAALVDTPGVRRADGVIVTPSTISIRGEDFDVNLVGLPPGRGLPAVDDGRRLRRPGELVIGEGIEAGLGDRVQVGKLALRVVGAGDGLRFNFGTPSIFMSLHDAQSVLFDGQPLTRAIAVTGVPRALPPGLKAVTNEEAETDLRRPLKNGNATVDLTRALLWLIAAGIIGAIVYLSAIERVRDFAVMKATGTSTRTLAGGLAIQSVLVSVFAAVLSIGVAVLVSAAMPFPAAIEAGGILQLFVVAVVVGLLASISGLRRAVTTDPALAFGGA
jgi:putative ABC transport system permease protein